MGLGENHYVLDTNILLYWLGDRLENTLPRGTYLVSVISEIELLSYAGLDLIADETPRCSDRSNSSGNGGNASN